MNNDKFLQKAWATSEDIEKAGKGLEKTFEQVKAAFKKQQKDGLFRDIDFDSKQGTYLILDFISVNIIKKKE